MRVNLYEQEYLSIKQIAEEWAKEPGKLSAQKIEQEIWRAYWLGHFVDENKQSTFMIPYEDREYLEQGSYPVQLINKSQEENYDKESIQYFAIVYEEKNGEIEIINFWVRHLYSSPKSYPLEQFYTKIINKDGEIDEVASKEHNNEFVSQIKNIVINNKDTGNANLDMNDDFVYCLIREYHIINLHHKMVAKYFPLERPFLFDRLYSNGLLEFTPKSLNKSFRKNESKALDNEDYKMLSEQNLTFNEDPSRYKLIEVYLNPFINPGDFVDVCKKLRVEIPGFLDTANINIKIDSAEYKKKENRGRKKGKPLEKYAGAKLETKGFLRSIKDIETKSIDEILTIIYDHLNKTFPQENIPEEKQISRWLKEFNIK